MKTGDEIPAILTIHQTAPGQYVVRIGDLRYRPLVVAVSKLLEDATLLILVTPAYIKVIRATDPEARGDSPGKVASRAGDAGSRDPSLFPMSEVPMESLDAETQAAIREQEEHSLPGEPTGEPVVPEAGMRVVHRARNGRFTAGHPEKCGRCRGEGKIQIIDEGGGPGEAACGVCQGTGVMTRYGAARH